MPVPFPFPFPFDLSPPAGASSVVDKFRIPAAFAAGTVKITGSLATPCKLPFTACTMICTVCPAATPPIDAIGSVVLAASSYFSCTPTSSIRLASHFAPAEGGVRLLVEERGARYPLTIDPIAQQAYLKPAAAGTTQAYDGFGFSVAVSGETVVVGAWQEDSSTTGVNSTPNDGIIADSGAAYIFNGLGAGASVSSVSPNPVPGSNSPQTFTIYGANFDPNYTVTLRNLTTGAIYPNRSKFSQSTTSITLNPNFGANAATWTVEVINPGPVSSGQYQFPVIAPATLVSVTVTGAPTLAAGGTTDYTATAAFSNGPPQDVSSQATWTVSGGLAGTSMTGHTLHAGAGVASTATVSATYGHNTGTRTATKGVAIGAGLSVRLYPVANSYVSGSGNNLNYRIQATAILSGGTGSEIASWMLDNTPIGTNALVLDATVLVSPGSHLLKATVTNGVGPAVQATAELRLPKAPQADEQYPAVGANLAHPPTLFNKDAVSLYAPTAPATNGLVVIIHGMDSQVTTNANGGADWMKRMAAEITTNLTAGPPNIILYDWHQDTDVTNTFRAAIRSPEEVRRHHFLRHSMLPPLRHLPRCPASPHSEMSLHRQAPTRSRSRATQAFTKVSPCQ